LGTRRGPVGFGRRVDEWRVDGVVGREQVPADGVAWVDERQLEHQGAVDYLDGMHGYCHC